VCDRLQGLFRHFIIRWGQEVHTNTDSFSGTDVERQTVEHIGTVLGRCQAMVFAGEEIKRKDY